MEITPLIERRLEELGWTVECQSPLEISHKDGARATNVAAKYTIAGLLADNYPEPAKAAKTIPVEGPLACLSGQEDLVAKALTSHANWYETRDPTIGAEGFRKLPVVSRTLNSRVQGLTEQQKAIVNSLRSMAAGVQGKVFEPQPGVLSKKARARINARYGESPPPKKNTKPQRMSAGRAGS